MDEHGGYAPRSPDLSAYHGGPSQSSAPAASSQQQQYQPPTPSYSGYQPPQYNAAAAYQVPAPQYLPPSAQHSAMQTSPYFAPPAPEAMADADYVPEQEAGKGRRKSKKGESLRQDDEGLPPAPGVAEGIEVKTKFPVARIKRIMQADEDVGKVAQVTPTAVSKALELFMISLVTKSAAQARSKSAKKVTAAHLKQVIQSDESFDFLSEIVSKVPDAPAPRKESKVAVDSGGEDEPKKKRGRAKRKMEDSD